MVVGIVIVSALVLGFAFEALMTTGKVHPGVTVSGVEVGGMIPEKALLVVEAGLAERVSSPVTVTRGDKTWPISAEEIDLTFKHDAMVAEAMSIGRAGGLISALGGRLRAWSGGVEIDAVKYASAPDLDVALEKVAKDTDVAPVDAGVRIEGTTPEVVSSKDGLALDKAVASRRVLRAFLASKRTVFAPVVTASPEVSNQEASEAAEQARRMLTGPVTVSFTERSWKFEPTQIAKWIAFSRSDADSASAPAGGTPVTLLAQVSAKKAAPSVNKALGTHVGRKAVDARFKTSNGEVTIVPSRDGVGPDLDALADELTTVLSDSAAQRTVELRTTIAKPKVTTEDARAMGIRKRISVFTTTYSAGNKARTNNIHTLGDALDGTLLAPDEVFSFNETIGQRTAAKGYQEANAIVNGKLVPQLGGGICQVGTTIFNTVFESGLPVTQRKNHSFYISHYPKGRDATISWGGPDFKFKNDTENWVLISVSYTSSSITIALYGTDPGYDVKASTSEWRNVKPFTIQKIKDATMIDGTTVIEDPGVDGKTITVKRTVSKGDRVIRTDEFVSVYRPKTAVVRVGTKPKPVPSDTKAEATDE
jgi:vancomycin resistance protein YoaR